MCPVNINRLSAAKDHEGAAYSLSVGPVRMVIFNIHPKNPYWHTSIRLDMTSVDGCISLLYVAVGSAMR